MSTKLCLFCSQPFIPCPQVQAQAYCSSAACQRERKARWQREKRATDPDYLENQARAQRAWLDRRPQYWKEYRARGRDLSTKAISVLSLNAKMDESQSALKPVSGLYLITFIEGSPRLRGRGWLADIQPYAKPLVAKKPRAKR